MLEIIEWQFMRNNSKVTLIQNLSSVPGDRLSSLKCKWLFQLTSNNDSMLVFPRFIPFGSIQAQLPQSHIQPRGTRARHGATWHLLLEGRRVCCEQLWRRQPETNGQMFVTWGCWLQTFAISMQIKTQFLVQVDAVWLLTTSSILSAFMRCVFSKQHNTYWWSKLLKKNNSFAATDREYK